MEANDVKYERRRGDFWFKIVSSLVLMILAGLTWWMNSINAKAERVPILEERMTNLQASIKEIKDGVIVLLERHK